MKQYSVDLMNCEKIHLSKFPAFHDIATDKLRLSFLIDILVKCSKTSWLDLPSSSLLDPILGSVSHKLNDITTISCEDSKYYLNISEGTSELVTDANPGSSEHLNTIMKHYTKLTDKPNIQLDLLDPKFLTKKISYPNLKRLYLTNLRESEEIFENSTKFNPHLKHFCLQSIENEAIMKREINQLADAAENDKLLNLSHLSIFYCEGMEGKLSGLFKSVWPHLEHLDLMGTRILETDLEFLILACNGTKKRLTNLTSLCLAIGEGLKTCFSTKFFVLPWLNLKRFYVINKCTDTSIHRDLSNAIRQNKLQNLTCLAINTMDLESLCLDNLSNLRVLHLVFSTPFRDFQKVIKTEMLSEIKLSSNFGLKGNMPSFITSSSLGQLTTLILNDSELSSNDLASLAQAELKGYLPLLKHLEMRRISYSGHLFQLSDFKCLFDGPCTWNKL